MVRTGSAESLPATGVISSGRTITHAQELWHAPLSGTPSRLITGSKFLNIATGSTVLAISMASGAKVWQHDLTDRISMVPLANETAPGPLILLAPVPTESLLLVGVSRGNSGHVVALDQKTGKIVWDFDAGVSKQTGDDDTKGLILSPPIIWKDRAVFRTGLGLTAVSVANGKEIWNVPMDANSPVPFQPNAMPVSDNHAIYFNSDFGIAYAFDPRNGTKLWSYMNDGLQISNFLNTHKISFTYTWCQPLISSGRLYISDGLGNAYALNATSGALVWKTKPGYIYQFSEYRNGVYIATENGFSELDAASGKTLRSIKISGGILQNIMFKNSYAILGSTASGWQVVDLEKWKIISSDPEFNPVFGIALSGSTLLLEGAPQSSPDQGELLALNIETAIH